MPRTGVQCGPGLAIEIDNLRSSYLPGDTITGRVTRTAQISKAESWINLSLYGRSKTKWIQRSGETRVTYRSRFNFFGAEPLELHRGPIHVAPPTPLPSSSGTSFSRRRSSAAVSSVSGDPRGLWPFAITIPTSLSLAVLCDGNEKAINRKDTFLDVNEESIRHHTLPPVFFGPTDSGSLWHGYVEYYIEAQLVLAQPTSFRVAIVEDRATFPLFIRAPSSSGPIADFAPCLTSVPCSRTAYDLVPGMGGSTMTVKKRARQLLHSSKCPRFAYAVEVRLPTVLQLAHPDPVPLLVRIVPDLDGTSHEVAAGNLPEVTLVQVDLMLVETTEAIFTSSWGRTVNKEQEDYAFGLQDMLKTTTSSSLASSSSSEKGSGISLPLGTNSKEPIYADIGALLQVRLGTHGVTSVSPATGRTMALEFAQPMAPSFETYNLRCRHGLRCELVVAVAGATKRVEVEVEDVTVLGMSEEQAATAQSELGSGGGMQAYNEHLLRYGLDVGQSLVGPLGELLVGQLDV